MTARRALVLVLLLFAVTVVAKLPARWLLPLAPAPLRCLDVGGTLWSGYCGTLRLDALTVSDLRWQLHAAALLHGALAMSLQSHDPHAPGHAELEWRRGGDLLLRDLAAAVPPALSNPLFPAGWSGVLSLDIAQAQLRERQIIDLVGTITLQQLRSTDPPLALGGYALRFAPHGDDAPGQRDQALRGSLMDLGGPLEIHGELTLTPGGNYALDGTATARDAEPELERLLALLGSADAQGRRMFSLTATL